VVLTGLLSVMAPLAGLWHGMEHVLLAPSNLSAAAVALLAGAVLAGALAACLAVRGGAADPAFRRAAREVLVRRVPSAARPGRGGPAPSQSTIGGPGGRWFLTRGAHRPAPGRDVTRR